MIAINFTSMYQLRLPCLDQGIYPTAIVVLVALQRSVWDMTASQRETPTQLMVFTMRNDARSSAISRILGLETRQSLRSAAVGVSFDHAREGDTPDSSLGHTETPETDDSAALR